MDELNLRFDFLLGKAKLTPNADQWKNWSGAYEKVYISKNQKKKQQQGQELALVSLADLDGFFKAGKRAEAKGQNYDNWIRSVGKKTFLSWPARASSRVAPSYQHMRAGEQMTTKDELIQMTAPYSRYDTNPRESDEKEPSVLQVRYG